MRSFFVVVLLACVCAALPLRADFSVDTVRSALDAENYTVLENEFQTAFEDAAKTKNFSLLRLTYSKLFVTANDARRVKIEAWLAEYPSSAFASTALAWSHYYMAFLYRGSYVWGATAVEAREAFHQELVLAKEMTDLALEVSPDFPPALDAAILLKQTHIDKTPVQSLLDHALDAAPDRHTLRLALAAEQPKWGGSIETMISICVEMAERVLEYDVELCMIEAVFGNGLDGPLRQQALDALETRDEAFLDYARLDAYTNEWSVRENAVSEAKRILRASLDENQAVSISDFQTRLGRVLMTFQLPLYKIEMQDALIAFMRKRLKDNPQSYRIHDLLITDIFKRASYGDPTAKPEDALELWQDMLAYGRYQPRIWQLGGQVDAEIHSWLNTERQRRYHVNEIYYSNHAPSRVREYMISLFLLHQFATGEETAPKNFEIDAAALKDNVHCPMFRSFRLYEAICQADPSAMGCNIGGASSETPDRVRMLMENSGECGWVKDAELQSLLFSPIPHETFLQEIKE